VAGVCSQSVVCQAGQLSIGSSVPLGIGHASMDDHDQKFIQDLCMFITAFGKHHLKVVESEPSLHPHLIEALGILVQISRTEDMETFKICLEYWQWLGANLYNDMSQPGSQLVDALVLQGTAFGRDNPWAARRELYAPVLSSTRSVMITKMARPEEVLIVQDENDPESIIQEVMKDTDAIMLYKSMRETLIYLTNLDVEDTEHIMRRTLAKQVDGSEWKWETLNTLCWAIGSISGAMTEEDEKRFLVLVIKELLGLCEKKKGKENKAVIASNIMYVVGQYPRFLRQHWKFLRTVVNKLFEFMHEPHPGVQDMACETFLKISEKCKRKFVTPQIPPDPTLFIHELLDNIDKHTRDFPQSHQTQVRLSPSQSPSRFLHLHRVLASIQIIMGVRGWPSHHFLQTFYEAVGHMVSAEPDQTHREQLVMRLCAAPNVRLDPIGCAAPENSLVQL
jgi:exportin-1